MQLAARQARSKTSSVHSQSASQVHDCQTSTSIRNGFDIIFDELWSLGNNSECNAPILRYRIVWSDPKTRGRSHGRSSEVKVDLTELMQSKDARGLPSLLRSPQVALGCLKLSRPEELGREPLPWKHYRFDSAQKSTDRRVAVRNVAMPWPGSPFIV